jgi:hypothetical protein
MKKVLSLSIAAILVSGIFASCKSHEKCPAYSKVDSKEKAKI